MNQENRSAQEGQESARDAEAEPEKQVSPSSERERIADILAITKRDYGLE